MSVLGKNKLEKGFNHAMVDKLAESHSKLVNFSNSMGTTFEYLPIVEDRNIYTTMIGLSSKSPYVSVNETNGLFKTLIKRNFKKI